MVEKLHPVLPAMGDGIATRHIIMMLVFFGQFCNYMLRVNINISLVSMINSKEERFNWDSVTQGKILSSFAFGYFFTNIIGGRLAEIYGSKRVYGFAILSTAILSCFIPIAASAGPTTLIIIRVVQGLAEGMTFPALFTLASQWIPPIDRSKYFACSLGTLVGTATTYPLCSVLIAMFGWQAPFYATAMLGFLWYIGWHFLMFDKPSTHPRISEEEKLMIEESIKSTTTLKEGNLTVPWMAILTSFPFYIAIIAGFGNSWGLTTLMQQGPQYLNHVLKFSLTKNGFLSAVPFIGRFSGCVVSSIVADHLRKKGTLSVTNIRRLFTIFSHIIPAICMLGLAYSGSSPTVAMTFIIVGYTFNGAGVAGGYQNFIDLSPNFCGVVFGIDNTIQSIPGMINPIINGKITTNNTVEEWQIVFWIASSLYFICGTVFIAFCSGEVQPWNYPADKRNSTIAKEETQNLKKISSGEHENGV